MPSGQTDLAHAPECFLEGRREDDDGNGAHGGAKYRSDEHLRRDPRIDHSLDRRSGTEYAFVGGARGTTALEQAVDSGKAAVAFSMFPVTLDDLMVISDAGGIMPPKSTWFEPKLRDGLLIHTI